MVRPSAVSGMFYPDTWKETKTMLDTFFNMACENIHSNDIDLIPRILISPHAGYIYSGIVAAHSYCALKKTKNNQKQFIILAPAHTKYVNGIALSSDFKWQLFKDNSPQIFVEQDRQILKKLKNLPFANIDDFAHAKEHAIEVQLPFLYYLYQDKFTFVPVVIGDLSKREMYDLAEVLKKVLAEQNDTVVIVSSDLSHYLPYDLAKKVDSTTIGQILKAVNSAETLEKKSAIDFKFIEPEQACGALGINTSIIVAKNLKYKAKALVYLNSGDTSGDKTGVVGYTSLIMGPHK